jgi:hypothetical protein
MATFTGILCLCDINAVLRIYFMIVIHLTRIQAEEYSVEYSVLT